ncbi:MAG: NUMOD4 domain-containing protein [Pseudomonadota bacterium]|nr:NUMOD4 domain-containing protein [Pseudomonadota bacterium]
MTREVWMPVPDYEDLYEVSNLGRVRRALSAPARSLGVPGAILKPSLTNGYLVLSLSKAGAVKSHRVHTLVMTAFCGGRPFPGAQICHNDGNSTDCRLTNLRWDSAYGNQADVERHGTRCRGNDVYGAKLTEIDVIEIRARIARGERNPPIANDFGVSISTIHLIRHNRTWRHVA